MILTIVRILRNRITFHATCPRETNYIYQQIGADVTVTELPNFMDLPTKVQQKEEENYFLFLGRIHPIKSIHKLLNALMQSDLFLVSKYKLFIAGDDTTAYADELKAMLEKSNIADKVVFVGYVDDPEEKQKLCANAHFLILPSESENFGNVVLEALAQGTPVIASHGTPWEILNEKQAGFWVNNNPEILQQTIDGIINLNPESYQSYRKSALKLAQEKFDINKNIQQWISLYQELTTQSETSL